MRLTRASSAIEVTVCLSTSYRSSSSDAPASSETGWVRCSNAGPSTYTGTLPVVILFCLSLLRPPKPFDLQMCPRGSLLTDDDCDPSSSPREPDLEVVKRLIALPGTARHCAWPRRGVPLRIHADGARAGGTGDRVWKRGALGGGGGGDWVEVPEGQVGDASSLSPSISVSGGHVAPPPR